MRPEAIPKTHHDHEGWARLSAALAALLGALVLAGWGIGSAPLTRLAAGLPAMVPASALGFVLGGAALWLRVRRDPPPSWRCLADGAALACGALGAASLCLALVVPGRELPAAWGEGAWTALPSLPTALSLTVLSAALLLLGSASPRRQARAQGLAAIAAILPLVAMIGYLFRESLFYGAARDAHGRVTGMAPHSALALLLLASGALAARAERGPVSVLLGKSSGGVAARRLLPAAVLVPVVVGWTAMAGVRGGVVGAPAAVAAAVVADVVVLAGLVTVLVHRLQRLDRERERLLARERAARAEAEEANAAKAQFLSTMSHELRTPLNAIQGHAQLIEMGVHGPVTPAQGEALGRIQAAQRHLLGLIAEVLDYAKLEAGRVEFVLEDVAVAEAVREVERLVAPQAAARGLALVVEGCDAALVVRADADRLRQVLLNLLSNAVKFTPAGGRVSLACGAAGPGRAAVRVRDTGIGIAPDQVARVFEPFVQVGRALTSVEGGTGLGLAISRDLARGMGGDLAAESAPGQGSTFTLTLPRVSPDR